MMIASPFVKYFSMGVLIPSALALAFSLAATPSFIGDVVIDLLMFGLPTLTFFVSMIVLIIRRRFFAKLTLQQQQDAKKGGVIAFPAGLIVGILLTGYSMAVTFSYVVVSSVLTVN